MSNEKPKTAKFSLRYGAVRIPAPTEAFPNKLREVIVETDDKGRAGKPVSFEVDAADTALVKMLSKRDNIDAVK